MLFLSLSVLSESMTEHAINHESINRTYLKYIPADLDLKNEVDLFIGIHGYTGTATGFEMQTTGGFNDAANKYKFCKTKKKRRGNKVFTFFWEHYIWFKCTYNFFK